MFQTIGYIFDFVLYKPLFNSLIFLYNIIPGHDFGIAIIALTLIIKLILYPVSLKASKSQKVLQDMQPKVKEIQEKYKNDKEKIAMATMELYKTQKINPFSGLFLAFVQLPILIALYQVFRQGINPDSHLNPMFFGLINLSKANLVFAIIAGVLQFYQTKMLSTSQKNVKDKNDMAQAMQTQMLYVFPIITVLILMGLPSALGLYWIVSSIFSIVQQYFILKQINQNG